jgi:hypothetical protein
LQQAPNFRLAGTLIWPQAKLDVIFDRQPGEKRRFLEREAARSGPTIGLSSAGLAPGRRLEPGSM